MPPGLPAGAAAATDRWQDQDPSAGYIALWPAEADRDSEYAKCEGREVASGYAPLAL